MNIRILYGFIVAALLVYSCTTARVAVQVTPENHLAGEYIEKYSAIAVSEMKRTGVPASIKLAQGMIESDFGRSRLARVANNHFGIKCHSSWKGPVIYHDDDARNECFRKYSRPEESYRDHSDFLVTGSRYRSLFDLDRTDYKGWARGLKNAGYATNPAYADMLVKKIEDNSLYLFDSGKALPGGNNLAGDPQQAAAGSGRTQLRTASIKGARYLPSVADRVNIRNRVEFIVVSEVDSRESLEQDFNLLPWELEKYNEKPMAYLLKPGNVIYLQPKRKRAELWVRYHEVREGESMYLVSQLYAIKLSHLYRMNFMEEGTEPEVGRRLNLR
jgi:hypothetical protein